jgi:hypothetical protein
MANRDCDEEACCCSCPCERASSFLDCSWLESGLRLAQRFLQLLTKTSSRCVTRHGSSWAVTRDRRSTSYGVEVPG